MSNDKLTADDLKRLADDLDEHCAAKQRIAAAIASALPEAPQGTTYEVMLEMTCRPTGYHVSAFAVLRPQP